MTAEWFSDDGRIVETAWGRFQDVPIFRALSREHNKAATEPTTGTVYAGEWVLPKGLWIDTDSFGPVTDLDGNVIG